MPLLPRIGPGEVVPLRRVRPDEIGGGAGQAALSDAAQTLGATTARLIDAERQADVARAEVGYGAKLAEIAQAIDQEPDVDAREAKFEEARRSIADEFRQGLRGQKYQADFDQRAFQLGERAKLAVREGVIRKRLDNARGGVIESVDKFDRLIEHSESDQLTKGYVFARSNILDAGVASGAVSAAERAQIEERSRVALEAVEMRKGSQDRADAIVAGGGSITAQLKAAREIEDPQMRDLVTARVKDMNQEAKLAENEAKEAQQDQVIKAAYGGELTHEQLQAMDVPAGLRQTAENILAQRTARGQPITVKTDQAVKHDLIDVFTNPRRADEAAKTDPMAYADRLNAEDLNTMRDLKAGKFERQEPLINAKVNERVRAFLQKKTTATPEEKQQSILYRQAVGEAVESERLRLGRVNLSDDEIDAVVDKQLETIAIPEVDYVFEWTRGTDTVKRYTQTGQFVQGVPADDHVRIRTEFLAADPTPPTDAEIRQRYIEELEAAQ